LIFQLDNVRLRKPESKDLEALYQQKNDPLVAQFLGGFSLGYSRADLADWLEFHRQQKNEMLWTIADLQSDACLGHVGLYKLDHRVRSAEFAILLGAKDRWGKGIGRDVTRFVVDYGFTMLNLNRIELSVLEHNSRARRLYQSLGFREEGLLRQAQYKEGQYLNLVLMALLREEYFPGTKQDPVGRLSEAVRTASESRPT
jgi:[ribosomal protein S5]-alanine N-acetyltransferase